MCCNKRKYDVVEYEQPRSRQSGSIQGMSWLPFAVILFFVFGSHAWGFVFQPWMWFLLPIAGVMVSSFFAKTHGSLMFNNGTRTQKILQQTEQHPYEQSYQNISYPNAVQEEAYSEGGQNFPYQQQSRYEEPYVDYQQPMSPME